MAKSKESPSQIEHCLTHHHHTQIREVATSESKTFWLCFFMAKSKRSLWLDSVMAESKGSPHLNWRLSDSPSSWSNQRGGSGRVKDFSIQLHHGRIEEIVEAVYKGLQLTFATVESERSHGRIQDSPTRLYHGWIIGVDAAKLKTL